MVNNAEQPMVPNNQQGLAWTKGVAKDGYSLFINGLYFQPIGFYYKFTKNVHAAHFYLMDTLESLITHKVEAGLSVRSLPIPGHQKQFGPAPR